jgi:type II secretory pathway pseudopilin PulG
MFVGKQVDMPYPFSLLASPHRTVSKAFTLSELAVSMGIIGVISLLTVPGVITFVEEAKAKATLKSTLGMVKEVVNNISQNGEFEVASATGNATTDAQALAVLFAKKFKTQKQCLDSAIAGNCCATATMGVGGEQNEPGLVLENGAVISGLNNMPYNGIVIDWNGSAVPNTVGINGDTLHILINTSSVDQGTVYPIRPGEVLPYPGDANLALYNWVMN